MCVFVLGIDGATFDIIEPMVADGKLPAFRRMMEEGAWGPLESTANQRSAAAWTSLMTGLNPGKHGIYEFYDYLPETYSLKFIHGGNKHGESLWRILGRHGKQVAVVNVPMTFPAEQVDGALIAGLDCPSTGSKGFCHPPSLPRELEKKIGSYIIEPGLTGAVIGGRVREAVDQLRRELGQKADVTRYLMQSRPWDFFMVVLRSLDAAQHTFWKYMDAAHPDHDPREASGFQNVIRDTYEQIDEFLGELLTTLEKEGATLLVMSDHGFGAKHAATGQINHWLASAGYLAFKPSSKQGSGLLKELYRSAVGLTSRRTKEWLWERFPRLRDGVQSRLCFADIDWAGTKAYSDSLFANVRINLRGRERDGTVDPGVEYEALVERLKSELLELSDSRSGERIVEAVFHREDIYKGPYVDKAPDLLIRWREDIPIAGIAMPGAAADAPAVPGEDHRFVSGDHRLHGIFLGWGPDVEKGKRIEGAGIVDIAPTVLHQMGLPVPRIMDGAVLSDIFSKGGPGGREVCFEDGAGNEPESTRDGYDTSEEKAIHQRLKDLGYVE